MGPHALHNVFWRCLSGPHAGLSIGNLTARRYWPGFSSIAAFSHPEQPDLDSLAAISEPGEALYVPAWNGSHVHSAWTVEFDSTMVAMAWEASQVLPPANGSFQTLGAEHRNAALELAKLTNPGPFGPLTLSMGEFVGHFSSDGQLIAMAGERTRAEQWHEISAICTHPDHQGKGLGRALTYEVVRRMLERGESPYLHVRSDNAVARSMYRKLGFREVLETPIRVIQRT